MISWGFKIMSNQLHVALHKVNFAFKKDGKLFFKDLNIDFKQGSINFVCGKNGVGKSTLLKILSAHPDIVQGVSGRLIIDGSDYDLLMIEKRLSKVGMVLQNFNSMLVDAYSFYENLQFALMDTYPLLKALPKVMPLPSFVEKYKIKYDMPIHLLSGGQRQILSILMVLQKAPRILLLDEPTAALDEENAALVMDFLHDLALQENITIIAIVHQHSIVKKYAIGSYFELYDDESCRSVRSIAID